jgi:conjugal transfer pilus assembly protein TraF
MFTRPVFLALLVACISFVATAQDGSRGIRIDDAYGDAFSNYKPYIQPAQPKREQPKKTAPQANTPTGKVNKSEQAVTAEWLAKNLPELQRRAIDNPTEENVAAEMYAQRILMDKAQRYEEARLSVVTKDPLLNENNRIPYASTGAQSIRNADYFAQQNAVKELAAAGGLMVFVDGTCRFCSMQMPIVAMLRANFGMEALVVSLDGRKPKNFRGEVQKDNGLFRKLGLKLTPSIVYVHKPKAYQGEADPNTYLIVSQGFYTADELVKLIAFAGHNREILSAGVMRDLNVWRRGVASSADLQALTLDATRPETFRDRVSPILEKQYR